MALIPKPPHIRILEAIAETLFDVDWEDLTGVENVTVRHHAMRPPRSDDKPCISIVWSGNSDQDIEEQYKSAGERVRLCHVDLQVDLVPKSDEATAADPNAGADPTGFLDMSRIAMAAVQAMRDEDSPTMAVATWPIDGEETPGEEAKRDNGRLVKSVNLQYRVSTTDPNRLFAPGEN